jgi:hypothetical protein
MENIAAVFIDPEVPEVAYEDLDFDTQLKHTQRIKNRILHKLVHSNPDGTLPTDKDSVELMLKVADSMDKSTIAKKRVNVEEKNGNSAISILTGIAEMVSKGGNTNLFAQEVPTGSNTNTDIGELPDFSNAHANGEAEVGVISETADSFDKRMEEVNRKEMQRREEAMGLNINPVAK